MDTFKEVRKLLEHRQHELKDELAEIDGMLRGIGVKQRGRPRRRGNPSGNGRRKQRQPVSQGAEF
jgi:hypothetical protein